MGKWWFSPNPSRGESCESCEFVYVRGLFVHQKCSNYALSNLLFGLCQSIWIIGSLIICFNPYPRIPAHPSYPQNVMNYEMYLIIFLLLFSFSDSHLSLLRHLGVRQYDYTPLQIWLKINYENEVNKMMCHYKNNVVI